MHCFSCYGAFFLCVFLISQSTTRGYHLCLKEVYGWWRILAGCQQPSVLRFFFSSGLGPPALSRSALLAASAPAVKCDHSAPLGPGLGAVREPNPWRGAFDGRARQHFERGRAASPPWDRTLVYTSSLPELSWWTEHIWQAVDYVMASLCTFPCFANLLFYD